MPAADASDHDALSRLLRGRWSCRGFQSKPVPRAIIEQILDLARLTPSWCNTQPWTATITDGVATDRFREALSLRATSAPEPDSDFAFPERYVGAYLERRRETAMQLYDSVGVARGDRTASAVQTARNFDFFGAPHAAVITTTADLGVYGALDCGLYVQTFLLAAQSLGVGAIPQAAFAVHSKFIRDFFDMTDDRRVVCGISFGYPDLDHPANGFRTNRASVEDTINWVAR